MAGHGKQPKEERMELGAFSVSLAVKDLTASKDFYQKLGIEEVMGDISQNWLILPNATHVIRLFQGMLERNALTKYTDVREIQRQLKARGLLADDGGDCFVASLLAMTYLSAWVASRSAGGGCHSAS
jgi:lactoylglutathione lyase